MRVGIIGDSQSVGLVRLGGLRALLEQRGDTITGTMLITGMGLASMRADPDWVSRARAVARGADVLIVILGGNNAAGRARYRELLDWFFSNVVRTKQKVLWVGPANSPRVPYHLETRKFQRAYFASSRVKWIDAWAMTTGLPGDGIHFNREGYTTWARRLVPELGFMAWGTVIGLGLVSAAIGVFLVARRRRHR